MFKYTVINGKNKQTQYERELCKGCVFGYDTTNRDRFICEDYRPIVTGAK